MIKKRIIVKLYKYFNNIKIRMNGIKLGCNANIIGPIFIQKHRNSDVKIGDKFSASSGNSYNPISRNICMSITVNEHAKLLVGDNCGFSSPCIWAHKAIIIGNNVNIGGDCILIDSDCHSISYSDRRSSKIDKINTVSSKIEIEDDVLIGARCIILKGVTIGARSIIGAGSVVSKSITLISTC